MVHSLFIICISKSNQSFLDQLAFEAFYEYTTEAYARNNLVNINRTLVDKLATWKLDQNLELKKHPMKELRWVTLGRHHNWLQTTPGDKETAGNMPLLLCRLGEELGKLLNFRSLFLTEASIINFYPANTSTIGIHRDDSGKNHF